MRIKLTALSAATLLCSSTLYAQQRIDTVSHINDEHIFNEVVVTGQYSARNADNAVQKIRVTDRKKIDAMGAQTLRDVLSNDMNIRISQDNVLGSTITMQGIGGDNVKILIDGVPVIGREAGNIDLSQINLNNIERIEIIEGPMSVSYGTDALAGTINLITKKTQRNTLEAGATAYYESIGTYNVNARAGMHKGKHTLNISGARNYFDGWNKNEKQIDFKPHIADSTRFQSWKPREQYLADLLYSYKTGNTTLSYKSSFFHEEILNRGMPTAPYGENAFDDYYYTQRIDNAFFLNSALSRHRNINFLAAYNDYKRTSNTYYDDLTTLHRELGANSGDQDTSKFHSFTSRATFSTSKADAKINYEAGYDVHYDNATGARIDNGKAALGDYAAFASAEYNPIQALTIRPGVRYGYNTAYNAPVTPSLNMSYKIADGLTIRGSYAKGFRAPSLKELYLYFVDVNHNITGNNKLQAEYSDNYSFSAIYSKRKESYNFKIEGSAFYNNVTNQIVLAQLVPGTVEYTYENITKYKTKGIQANAELGIAHFRFALGGSYLGTYNMLSETESVAAFSYSPEINGSISYEWKKYGLSAALFYKYTGRSISYYLDDKNALTQGTIGEYNTADASVTKSFYKNKLSLTVGGKNLFNVINVASTAVSTTAHSSSTGEQLLNCGRYYFIKLGVNLSKQ